MIEFVREVASWLGDPANWAGRGGVPNRLWEHLSVAGVALAISGVAALPAAVSLGHRGRGGLLAVTGVNLWRSLPSFGIVGIAFPITLALGLHPLGYWATLVALVALALPPMFVNAYTGVRQIDAALVEAARGMGMSERQVLGWVELPLALPVIMAGIRTAVVEVLATATIGAVVGFGGLGRYIIDGFAQRKFEEVFVGGVLVALLVIVAESSLRWAQRRADFANRKGSDRPAMSSSAEVADPVRVG